MNSLIAATVISALDAPVPLAINTGNAFQLAFVFPLGMWMLMTRIFGPRDMRTYLGAVCASLFLASPWELFMRAAPLLYAYVAGMALVPSALALVMDCFGNRGLPELPARGRLGAFAGRAAMALAGLASVALGHPSALFSAILFVIPYIAYAIVASKGNLQRGARALLLVAYIAACAAVWIALVHAPFMQTAVLHECSAAARPIGGMARVLVLEAPHLGMQYVLGLVVLIGAVACLRNRATRWLLAPYLMAAVLYWCCLVVAPGELRSLLTGFWYNHASRLGLSTGCSPCPLPRKASRPLRTGSRTCCAAAKPSRVSRAAQ